MKLLSGHESQERFNLIISLTSISSESIINALSDHLVNGYNEKMAYMANGVPQQNFNRALNKLNAVAGIIEQIKVIDYNHLSDVKRG